MPAPLANRIIAIEAPVSSFRHSIFSEMPFSDFSRHGIFAVSSRISSSAGAPAGNWTMVHSAVLGTLYRHIAKVSSQQPLRKCLRQLLLGVAAVFVRCVEVARQAGPAQDADLGAECLRRLDVGLETVD